MKHPNKSHYYLLMIIIVFTSHAVYLNCVAEDAYITFRFAKNLANGHGITWNVGESPVEGYTNFLWIVIFAMAVKLGLNEPLLAQIIGIVASLATIVYTYNFSRRLLNFETTHSLIPCLFLAVSGPFATWAASGMESNFFGMLLFIACYHFTAYWKSNKRRDLLICYAVLFLATLTRPEGLMVFIVLLALVWALSTERPTGSARAFLLPILLYVVPFSVYFAWRFKYFGYPLPNTFYAKTSGTVQQYIKGAIYSGFFFLHYVFPFLSLPLLMIWDRGCPITLQYKGSHPIRLHMKKYTGLYVCGLISLVYTLCITYLGGDYMAMYRFYVPLLPFIYILFGLITSTLFSVISTSQRKRAISYALLAFAVALTIIQSTPLEPRLFRAPPFQHGNFQGVQRERWHVARLSLIGNFFNAYKKSEDESIATRAIGAISYYSSMRVYDIYGIVDTHIAHIQLKGRPARLGLAGHEKMDLSYTLSKKPTYFMFSRSLTKRPMTYPNYTEKIDKLIRENYRLISVKLNDKGNREDGYFTFLELKEHIE